MSHNTYVINGTEPTTTGTYSIIQTREMIAVGRGAAALYSTSPATSLGANANLYLYDPTPVNTITSASITLTGSWVESVTLPAGNYMLMGYFSALFSATGNLEFAWHNGSAFVGNGAVIGASVISTLDGARISMAGLTLTSTTTLRLRVIASANVSSIASQGNTPAEESWMLIEKV